MCVVIHIKVFECSHKHGIPAKKAKVELEQELQRKRIKGAERQQHQRLDYVKKAQYFS